MSLFSREKALSSGHTNRTFTCNCDVLPLNPTKNTMENLENTFPVVIRQEFTPHIANTIFNLLDEEELVKSRSVSSVWKNVVDSSTKLWTNPDLYKKAALEGNLDICQKIIRIVENKNPPLPLNGTLSECYPTPLHIAAQHGQVEICRLIMGHLDDKNPKNDWACTPLHSAAMCGSDNPEVYRLIMNEVDDKNPKDFRGMTPLHIAAMHGNLQVCQLIIQSVDDKNPPNSSGNSPLHCAAGGCRGPSPDICRLILENVDERHPVNNAGKTPLDVARNRQPRPTAEELQEIEQLWLVHEGDH